MAKKKTKGKKTPAKESLLARCLAGISGAQTSGLRRQVLRIGLVLAAVVGMAMGFRFLDGYVHGVAAERDVALTIQLLNPPEWMSDELIRDICLSTGVRRNDYILDDTLPRRWAENLDANPWVQKVRRVHRRYDGRVVLDCEIRRPIARVIQSQGTFLLDAEGVVLPDAALRTAAGRVVELRGEARALPAVGEVVDSVSLQAGLQVLVMIRKVDESLRPEERLWGELAALDVSNYEGRRNHVRPHLTLYTTNDVEIRWGAALGRSVPFNEASAQEKLESLYRAHRQMGTLCNYQFVELRNPYKQFADPLRHPNG